MAKDILSKLQGLSCPCDKLRVCYPARDCRPKCIGIKYQKFERQSLSIENPSSKYYSRYTKKDITSRHTIPADSAENVTR